MYFYIKKLKIANFLSFFGEHEVNLKPFTAIMCNYYEGKDDFFRAFEFVLGAKLIDLRVENPLDLVHSVLREEITINHEVQSYVEITLDLFKEQKQLTFFRGMKTGLNSVRIEHKIGEVVTPGPLYDETLNSLNLHVRRKNFIFYKSYFNNVIWGSSENLEMTICACMRETYLFEEWQKTKKEVDSLTQIKLHTAKEYYNSVKNSHVVIAKFAKKFEAVSDTRESIINEIIRYFPEASSDESSPAESNSTEREESLTNVDEKNEKIFRLETQMEFLTNSLDDLKLKEAHLISRLYHEEVKLAKKSANSATLLNRVRQVKSKVGQKEHEISKIWNEMLELKSELEDLTQKISFAMFSLEKMQTENYLQNRFTSYGRFYDYLQPSRYVQLLKQIIGDDIFYANLCDSLESAFSAMDLIKTLDYEQREVFISFNQYSHKLKDVLTASGEKGVQINTLEQLLIFLCKLKQYEFIDEVPVMVQRSFDFDDVNLPKFNLDEYVIYIQNGLHFTNEGLIKYTSSDNTSCVETEKQLQETLFQLQAEEEIKYQEWNDLFFMKWRKLEEMHSLENDIFYLKRNCKKITAKPHLPLPTKPLPERSREVKEIPKLLVQSAIFTVHPVADGESTARVSCAEYFIGVTHRYYPPMKEIFKDCTEELEKFQSQLQVAEEEEEVLTSENSGSSDFLESSSEEASNLAKDLENIVLEQEELQYQLKVLKRELRFLHVVPLYSFRLQKKILKLNNLDKKKLFFEKEFKKLKKLMANDEFDDFLASQEWRGSFIAFLTKHFNNIKNKLKVSTKTFKNISEARREKLYPFLEHCSQYLAPLFRDLLSDALPFIEVSLNSGEEKLQIMSSLGEERINLVEMNHFNTFLKFIGALSIFLEISVFEKIPLMILDDLEEYFPSQVDNLEAVLDSTILEKIIPQNTNPRHYLLMRVGKFLERFIKKHSPRNNVRKNGTSSDHPNGPIQMIFFAKEGLIHSANHYVWIHKQVLPEDYITDYCNSYSEIHEIKVE